MTFSYQLYSSRNWPLSETIPMLAEAGYTGVEGYGALFADASKLADLKGLLTTSALSMPTGHFSLDQIEGDPDNVISTARELGIETVFCPHIGPDFRPGDAEGWRAFGARLESAGAPLRAAGLGYGWHNHDFEFVPLADGTIPMEHILAGGPSLGWEADIAWIVRGGGDPMDWIDRHGDRILAVHVKDIAPAGECVDEDGWADVGHGTMDWRALLAAARKTPAKHFIMEHDKPSDHVRFARRSLDAVSAY